MKLEFSRQIFEKILKYQTSYKKIPSVGVEQFHADGLKVRHDEDNSRFSEFCERAFTMAKRADQLHHDNAPANSTAGGRGAKHHITQMSVPLQPRFGFLRILAFPRAKIAVEREEICECDGHTVHQLSQRRLTAD